MTSYVEENKEWVKSVAADATSAIKENVKVILLEFIINEIFNDSHQIPLSTIPILFIGSRPTRNGAAIPRNRK